ncbi:hypothetical protein DIPPA_25145 [Diplonema papillatum]|nr:hypothetical protein DIPPA_25145 [Diplonema papillatum]
MSWVCAGRTTVFAAEAWLARRSAARSTAEKTARASRRRWACGGETAGGCGGDRSAVPAALPARELGRGTWQEIGAFAAGDEGLINGVLAAESFRGSGTALAFAYRLLAAEDAESAKDSAG